MPFCANCGTELVENAKFCQKCGNPTKRQMNGSIRQQEFVGKIYKCPSCGEILKSFETICPACGLELRGTRAPNAVKEFALKLEAIESKREYGNLGFKTDEQKISLIKSFSVPNTKEDIIDFMILAYSNIDVNDLTSMLEYGSYKKSISNAWFAKFEQAYEKAKICFSDDDLKIVNAIYDKKMKQIRKARLSFPKILAISIIGTFSFFVFMILYFEKLVALLI